MDFYLDRYADLSVQCESGAALRRLESLGLAEVENGRARAVPLAQAVAAVRAAHDRHFGADPAEAPGQLGEIARHDGAARPGELSGIRHKP
jgi:hypothetical protein